MVDLIEGVIKTETEHFDIYRIKNYDAKEHGRIPEKLIEERQAKGVTKPCIFFCDLFYNITGTEPGRIWFPIEGNLHAFILFPHKLFKTYMEDYVWPLCNSKNIHKVMEKIAPGEYFIKPLNDIVCTHGCKTVGILARHYLDWQYCQFAVNIAGHPPKEKLRSEGLEACHMYEHCKAKIDPLEMTVQIAEGILRDLTEGTDFQDTINYYRDSVYKNPNRKAVIVTNERATYPEMKRVSTGNKEDSYMLMYKYGDLTQPPLDDEGSMYVDYFFEYDKI